VPLSKYAKKSETPRGSAYVTTDPKSAGALQDMGYRTLVEKHDHPAGPIQYRVEPAPSYEDANIAFRRANESSSNDDDEEPEPAPSDAAVDRRGAADASDAAQSEQS
jgi:hypothetical protein